MNQVYPAFFRLLTSYWTWRRLRASPSTTWRLTSPCVCTTPSIARTSSGCMRQVGQELVHTLWNHVWDRWVKNYSLHCDTRNICASYNYLTNVISWISHGVKSMHFSLIGSSDCFISYTCEMFINTDMFWFFPRKMLLCISALQRAH